jgi:hypothetical protein
VNLAPADGSAQFVRDSIPQFEWFELNAADDGLPVNLD